MKSITSLIYVCYCSVIVQVAVLNQRIFFQPVDNLQKLTNEPSIAKINDKIFSAVKESDMDIVATDGVKLKATYYSPEKPGPGMLLLHQCNMDRKSWRALAIALAQRGIHIITFDYRGYGESPKVGGNESLASDIDAAFAMLISQPGVDKTNIGVGGASCGVNNAVQFAKRNGKIKALILLSGPVMKDGLTYLQSHPDLAIFGAASSEEDFAVKAIREVVATSTNPASTMKELTNAGHGAPMFSADPKLLDLVASWTANVLK